MSCTESVPQREGTIIHPTFGLVYLLVRAIILSIHITIDSRSNHAMIKSSIEVHLVVCIASLHFHTLQLLVPISLSRSQILVKVIMRSFRIQILHGTFYTYTRKSCNHCNLFPIFGIEHKTSDMRSTYLFAFQLNIGIVHFHILEWFRETSGKIDLLTSSPTFRETITTDIARVHYFNLRIHGKVPVHGLLQVQNHHGFCFREGIALHTTTRSSSQFHIDIVILQFHSIVTSRSFFILMRELGMDTQFPCHFLIRQSDRHK